MVKLLHNELFFLIFALHSPRHLTYTGSGRVIPLHALQTTVKVFFWLMVSLAHHLHATFMHIISFLFTPQEDLMRINQNVMNSRLRTRAEHINTIEYPMFEQVMNVHIQRHQHVLSLLESQWRAVEESNKKTYCSYLHRINVSAECSIDLKDASLLDVKVDGCLFPPITPNLYYK